MDEPTNISFLGLPQKDATIITSMLRLWSTLSPVHYRILAADQLDEASLVFLDTDNLEALQRWQQLSRRRPTLQSIKVGNPTPDQGGITLSRPLIMRHVQDALQHATRGSRLIHQKTTFGMKVGRP